MVSRSLFSSATGEWETPQDVFDDLNAEFGPFDLDPCATPENAKCKNYYTSENNGLVQPWWGKVFVNPPYGRGIGAWIGRCYQVSRRRAGPYACYNAELIVALIPSRTDTVWWHDYVMKADEIRFIRGRLKFGGAKNSAPFPSVVVIWEATS